MSPRIPLDFVAAFARTRAATNSVESSGPTFWRTWLRFLGKVFSSGALWELFDFPHIGINSLNSWHALPVVGSNAVGPVAKSKMRTTPVGVASRDDVTWARLQAQQELLPVKVPDANYARAAMLALTEPWSLDRGHG